MIEGGGGYIMRIFRYKFMKLFLFWYFIFTDLSSGHSNVFFTKKKFHLNNIYEKLIDAFNSKLYTLMGSLNLSSLLSIYMCVCYNSAHSMYMTGSQNT